MARRGDVCGLQFGPFSGILFNKPEHLQSILVEHASDFDKGMALLHHKLPPEIHNGIFCSEGEFHNRQRKLMAPAFQPRHIAGYADIMGYYGEHIQATWPDGSVIDAHQQMTNLTLSIIGKALFDADMFHETNELGAAMRVILAYLSHIGTFPYSWPTPRNRRTRTAIQVLRVHLQRFIDERRAVESERSDFLSLLLQARDEKGAPMPDNQLMTECLNLFGAGHETTATALTWAWYLLCQHPEIYHKVQQEVDSILQGRTPTYTDLARLPYCLQVFKEALRLYPPAYFTVRRALYDIEIDGYQVPKSKFVLFCPYTLHRREEYFPDPEKFDPERFTPAQEKQRPRYAYLPFGAGPRICIGLHFTMMEGHLLLATLAQRVSFSLVPNQAIGLSPKNSLVLRPNRKVNLVVTKRTTPFRRETCFLPLRNPRWSCPQAEVES